MKTIFYLTPTPKPRMTQRDRWANRDVVLRYYAFKDDINLKANAIKYTLPDTFKATFYLSPPMSWSVKKRASHEGKPHQSKPDKDNLEKALLDALKPTDQTVWDTHTRKLWSIQPRIEIEEL